jgi:hypothetical protein
LLKDLHNLQPLLRPQLEVDGQRMHSTPQTRLTVAGRKDSGHDASRMLQERNTARMATYTINTQEEGLNNKHMRPLTPTISTLDDTKFALFGVSSIEMLSDCEAVCVLQHQTDQPITGKRQLNRHLLGKSTFRNINSKRFNKKTHHT